jgi:transcriptional regulator with XRE-family HTH domain
MSKTTQKKRITNVVDLVRDIADDDFVAELEQQLAERSVIKSLIAERVARNLSQDDIAKHLKCTQSRVSKIEAGKDADLTLGEMSAYASAFGCEFDIVPHPRGSKIVDRVKTYARCIDRELKNLVQLAADDQTIATGAKVFLGEAIVNLVGMVKNAAKELPNRPSISMQLSDDVEPAEVSSTKKPPVARKRASRKSFEAALP